MKYLNLGCGSRFHPEWINLDLFPAHDSVKTYDLGQPLPFEDETFDVVYHSHVLEHLRKNEVLPFLRECRRVLKVGGILRIALPDLENIAKSYLQTLERALQREPGADNDHCWMVMELFDQAVRERPGGAMLEYMRHDPIPNEEFVLRRMGGEEAQRILKQVRGVAREEKGRSLESRKTNRTVSLLTQWRLTIANIFLTKAEKRALKIGQFRSAGEIHHWMYDRYSLARILKEAGFHNPVRRSPFESTIPNWSLFHLDTEPDGSVYKPDSLYMEALRPA